MCDVRQNQGSPDGIEVMAVGLHETAKKAEKCENKFAPQKNIARDCTLKSEAK